MPFAFVRKVSAFGGGVSILVAVLAAASASVSARRGDLSRDVDGGCGDRDLPHARNSLLVIATRVRRQVWWQVWFASVVGLQRTTTSEVLTLCALERSAAGTDERRGVVLLQPRLPGHGTRARSRRATSRADVRDGRDASRRVVGAGMIGQLRPPAEMAMMAWSLAASGERLWDLLSGCRASRWTGNPRRDARTRRVSALLGECMPFWVATSNCAKLTVPACWAGL
jgi:hypothetical protein